MKAENISAPEGVEGCRVTLAQGESMRRHSHAYEHSLDVLSGDLSVEIDGVVTLCGSGASVTFPSWLPHSFSAPNGEVVVDIWHSIAAMEAADAEHGFVTKGVSCP